MCYNTFMLNPLPELLSFGFLAPSLLRVIVGAYFLKQVWFALVTNGKKPKNELSKYIAGLELIGAIAVIVGFYTQIAVLILIATTLTNLVLDKKSDKLTALKKDFYLLLFAILISLLFTGAGFCAIDLPL